jgi:tetratricopeptide (TPR) repeat protein
MNRKERRATGTAGDKLSKWAVNAVRMAGGADKALRIGLKHHHAGRRDRARAIYDRVLEFDPKNADALHLRGLIAFREEKHDDGERWIREAIAIDGQSANYYINLGLILRAQRRFEEAVEAQEKAIELNPGSAEAHNGLAAVLLDAGRVEEAIAAFRRATELDPTSARAYSNLGAALSDLGRNDEAAAAYRKALVLKPDYISVYRYLGQLKKFTPDDPELAAMERLARERELGVEDRIELLFALGKAYEDIEDYDRAFDAYAEGNRLKRSRIDYDIAAEQAKAERIIASFGAELLACADGVGNPSELPVFIVGLPRSGTSLVEQILASHPEVHGAGELRLTPAMNAEIKRFVPAHCGLPFPEFVSMVAPEGWRAAGEAYVAAVSKLAPGASRITDKMPFNFLWVGLIHMALPKARIIQCRRNALDTCLSCFKRHFVVGSEFCYDLDELGAYYRLYDRVMAHWHRALPGKILTVDYEELVADLPRVARGMIAHCGLDWTDACLEFHKTQRAVQTASASQVRRPIYTSSVELWRRYGDRLAPLKQALETKRQTEVDA